MDFRKRIPSLEAFANGHRRLSRHRGLQIASEQRLGLKDVAMPVTAAATMCPSPCAETSVCPSSQDVPGPPRGSSRQGGRAGDRALGFTLSGGEGGGENRADGE